MDWIHLPEDVDHWRTLVNMVMYLQDTQNVGKIFCRCETISF
jgi:hypothetical protein